MTVRSLNYDIVDKSLIKFKEIHEIFETHKDKKYKGFMGEKSFKSGYFKKINQIKKELYQIIEFGRLYDNDKNRSKSMLNELISMYNKRIDLLNDEYRKKSIPENLFLSKMQSIL